MYVAGGIIVAWLCGAAVSYFWIRGFFRRVNGEWAVGDRRLAIVMCVMMWPLLIAVVKEGTGTLLDRILESLFGDDTPSSW